MSYKLIEKIFSVKNKDGHKIIKILGLNIKIKQKIDKNFIIDKQQEQTTFIIQKLDHLYNEMNVKILNRLDDIYYNMQVLTQVPVVHKYISQFKGINEGKDVVCIAPGPTIKYYKPIKDVVHVGINGVFRNFTNLDYLFLMDYFVTDSKLNEEIDSFKPDTCKKFYSILPQRRIQFLNRNFYFTDRIPESNFIKANAYPLLMEDVWHGKLAINLESEPVGDWGGSVFSALQFIMYTHPKRIYLVGNDCSKGRSYETYKEGEDVPDYTNRIEYMRSFKDWADRIYPDVEIISINPVGLKGIFKDEYTEEYLKEINNEIKN